MTKKFIKYVFRYCNSKNINPTCPSDLIKKELQVLLAEPVGKDILLNLEQFRNHQHQRVDVNDKLDDRQVPTLEKFLITLIMVKQGTPSII